MQIILSQHDVARAISEYVLGRFIVEEDQNIETLLGLDESNEIGAVVNIYAAGDDADDDSSVEEDNETLAADAAPKRRKRRTKAEIEADEAAAQAEAKAEETSAPVEDTVTEPEQEKPWTEEEPAKEEIGSPEPAFTEAAPTVGSDSSSTSQETPIADTAPSQIEVKTASSIFPNIGSSAPDLTPKVEPAVAAKSLFANLTKTVN